MSLRVRGKSGATALTLLGSGTFSLITWILRAQGKLMSIFEPILHLHPQPLGEKTGLSSVDTGAAAAQNIFKSPVSLFVFRISERRLGK